MLIALLAAIVGAATGGALTMAEFAGVEEVTSVETPRVQKNQPRPRVEVVNGRTHEFGVMQLDGKMEHSFIFKNTGEEPLTLKQLDTSCMCTLSHLEAQRLMPGKTTNVTLTWTPSYTSSKFTQTAEIGTNDPLTPVVRLRITGAVQKAVELSPSTIDLRSFTTSESREESFDVLSFTDQPIQLSKIEVLPPGGDSFYELEQAPLPTGVAAEKGAKSGVRVKVRVKSGLPLGRIQRRIRLSYAEGKSIEAELIGSVISDITWVATASGFNRNANLLKLGSIAQGKGKVVRMHLVVKGPHRQDVKLEVLKTDPPKSLHAEIGDAVKVNGGRSLMYPVTLTVPKDSPPLSRLGLTDERRGVVVIATTHPNVKQVRLLVNFAVEPE